MAVIDSIKQKILQLDAGSFQNLCNALLAKMGYTNTVALGSLAGTNKTTKGTPDTYCYDSKKGQYIFVECTTQQSKLAEKIKSDINKCLDVSKTKIPHEKISEIIYYHTSSNITPKADNDFRSQCEAVGIKLTIIGIDQLAEDLYSKHRWIAKEYLGISIGTGQIQDYSEFIKQYDSNKLAAPLETQFLFRENEIALIDEAFENNNVVILTGSAGTGKTRLALHYARQHAQKYGEQFFCIRDNALPLYEELKLYIDKPGSYFLFVDDANQISGLQHVIEYSKMQTSGYSVKILITVRDYAIQKVKNEVCGVVSYQELEIKKFSDEEIKKLLIALLDIKNENYLNRIIDIAEGNARIAMLAGKIACESNRLDSINDVSQLYEDYYGTALQKTDFFANEYLIVTAGIVAFLSAIHLDNIETLIPVIEPKGMNKNSFIENIHKLHELEILDICNDKAVRFSDQCMSNFLLQHIFADKKFLSISSMIKACFATHKQRVIGSINTLLGVFRSETLHEYVRDEIIALWNELRDENSPHFFEYVKSFSRINPTETLLIVREKVEAESQSNLLYNEIDINTGKNYNSVDNDIINLLGGFADSTDLSATLDLFFKYYLKKPDLFIQFYHASNNFFGIKKESHNHDYYTTILFFEKLREYSETWTQKSIAVLFLEVADMFLRFTFHPSEGGKNNQYIYYTIPLIQSDGTKKYRELIWKSILELSKFEEFQQKIRKILMSYNGYVENESITVVEDDLPYISNILVSSFPPDKLNNCITAKHIESISQRLKIKNTLLFSPYLKSKKLNIYNMLKGAEYRKNLGYEKREQAKRQKIENYVAKCDFDKFKELIDICRELDETDDNNWEVSNGLKIAFSAFAKTDRFFASAVKYYLSVETPLNLYPDNIISALFNLLSADEVFSIINEFEFKQKNFWLYVYYCELPKSCIDAKTTKQLDEFLNDTSDKLITTSPLRDVCFLEKYNSPTENVFINGCKIILSKVKYSPFIVTIYFSLLFNHYRYSPKQIIEKFKDELVLLEDLYITMMSCEKDIDHDGEFLKEIYLVSPTILIKYTQHIVNLKSYYHSDSNFEKLRICFTLENFIEIIDDIVNKVIIGAKHPYFVLESFFKSILLSTESDKALFEQQNNWIEHAICLFSNDKFMMRCLFSVITECFSVDRKMEYIKLFLEHNQDFNSFKELPLTPNSYGWTNSAIPLYSSWIEFLQQILPLLVGLKFIQHKKHVEDWIDSLKQRIEKEEIREMLEG